MVHKHIKKHRAGILALLVLAGICCCPARVDASSVIQMNPGQTKTLKLSGGGKNAVWSSNKKKVAKVNSGGVVKAAAQGKAIITAKTGKGTKKYTIKVRKVQLSHSKLTMKTGETKQLAAKGALGRVFWHSSSGAVKVNSKGEITAMKKGKAVVTASVFGKKYRCTVTVKDGGQKTYNILVTVGKQEFPAALYDSETTRAFLKKLPMTITMSELNGNEKYYYFSNDLPTNSKCPGKIHAGDIMLYGSDCLVLFYDDFSTSYSYTSLGTISDPDGLGEALGSGTVQVSFSLK